MENISEYIQLSQENYIQSGMTEKQAFYETRKDMLKLNVSIDLCNQILLYYDVLFVPETQLNFLLCCLVYMDRLEYCFIETENSSFRVLLLGNEIEKIFRLKSLDSVIFEGTLEPFYEYIRENFPSISFCSLITKNSDNLFFLENFNHMQYYFSREPSEFLKNFIQKYTGFSNLVSITETKEEFDYYSNQAAKLEEDAIFFTSGLFFSFTAEMQSKRNRLLHHLKKLNRYKPKKTVATLVSGEFDEFSMREPKNLCDFELFQKLWFDTENYGPIVASMIYMPCKQNKPYNMYSLMRAWVMLKREILSSLKRTQNAIETFLEIKKEIDYTYITYNHNFLVAYSEKGCVGCSGGSFLLFQIMFLFGQKRWLVNIGTHRNVIYLEDGKLFEYETTKKDKPEPFDCHDKFMTRRSFMFSEQMVALYFISLTDPEMFLEMLGITFDMTLEEAFENSEKVITLDSLDRIALDKTIIGLNLPKKLKLSKSARIYNNKYICDKMMNDEPMDNLTEETVVKTHRIILFSNM